MLGASHCKQAKDYVDIPWKPGMYLAPNIINRRDSGEQEHMKTYENIWKQLKTCEHDITQWIGLWENLRENTIFNGKIYGFRCQFSPKPIHWIIPVEW